MKKYIYINSYPRSGSTFIQSILNSLYGFSDNNILILKQNIVKEHFAPNLLCSIPDTLQVSTFRDPIECVSSYIMKDIGDFISVPKFSSPKFNDYLNIKIDLYNQYLENTTTNYDNLLVFSFKDVVSNTAFVIEKIDSLNCFNPLKNIDQAIYMASNELKQSSYYTPYHNNYPIKKGDSYESYKKYLLENNIMFNKSYDLFNHLKSL